MRILIVEDEALLALDMEAELETAGHEVVGTAMTKPQAERLIEETKPDFAFVDIHLIDGPTGIDVGRALAARAIPFVFVTGNVRRIPDDFAGAIGAIEKPYTSSALQNALTFLMSYIVDGRPETPPPSSLIKAPQLSAMLGR